MIAFVLYFWLCLGTGDADCIRVDTGISFDAKEDCHDFAHALYEDIQQGETQRVRWECKPEVAL